MLALLAGASLTACGGDTEVAGDCAPAVRLDGVVYIEQGDTQQPAERFGTAERAWCDDIGDDAGIFFTDDGEQVPVWSFPGHDPAKVLGVGGGDGSYGVLFAEDLTETELQELETELQGAEPSVRQRAGAPAAGAVREGTAHLPVVGRPLRRRRRRRLVARAERREHRHQGGDLLGRRVGVEDAQEGWLRPRYACPRVRRLTRAAARSSRAHDARSCLAALCSAHRGMFPCFFAGSVSRFERSSRSARTTSTRVSCGLMTAST